MRYGVFAVSLVALALALAAPVPVQAKGKAKSGDLIRELNRAAAFVGKAVKEAKLDAKQKQNEPFLAALKKTSQVIDDLEKAATAKNDTYWNAMHRMAGAVQQLEAASRNLSGKTPGMADGVKKLGAGFELYRHAYGKQSVRKKKGGSLTDKEKAAFAKLKEQDKKTLAELEKLKASAAKNAALVAELAELIRMTNAVIAAEVTVDAYCDALYWVEDCEGSWEFCLDFVIHEEPEWVVLFETSHQVVSEVESVYWTSMNEVAFEAADWATLDVEIEVTIDISVEISDAEVTDCEAYVESVDVEVEEYTFEEDNDDDNDGIADAQDDDDDNDGIKDDVDLDDDGDGELDVADSDLDHDGISDEEDEDDDNDGIADDKDDDDDNDGVKDDDDEDSDNDGVADEDEGDLDEDGTPDCEDADDDNDGTPDDQDADDDNDGTPDDQDEDDDNDGTSDADEADDGE